MEMFVLEKNNFVNFIGQVTASAWLNDLRNQIEQTRILSTVYRSASALGSRLPSIASARARVAGAGCNPPPGIHWNSGLLSRLTCPVFIIWLSIDT